MEDHKAEIGDHKEVDEKTPFNAEDGDVFESSKVKFINGGAKADTSLPEIRLDLEKEKKKENEFCGLTKDELMKYADDPFWVRVRIILLVLFWVAWIGMLVAAILIIVFAPKCAPRPKLDWWQKTSIYQVYPRSFKDTNDDGIGDIKGIHDKLDDLLALNITTVWLNPIFPSSNFDFGYDVTDFTDVNPEFGSLADFRELRAAMHKKGMRLILDFVPNHTSKKHRWFNESSKGDDNAYADYYVWHEGRNGGADPPNNWLSVFGGPAWTKDETRGKYYLHQFLPEQPDLNLRNKAVQDELEKALLFWLNEGVDGFRVDAAPHLFEAEGFMDEPPSGASGDGYDSLEHNQTKYLPESYEMVTEWRKLLDDYSDEEGRKHPRVLLVEATGAMNQTMGFYKHNGKEGAHMPLNFNLLNMKDDCDAKCISGLVKEWRDNVPKDKWSNWRTGNHDHSRVATRMGRDLIDAMNMLTMTLPGTSITYYGEELGMVDVDLTFEQTKDTIARRAGPDWESVSRDPKRTPMQWNDKKNAGFSSADDTWLPVAPDYRDWNVKSQNAHGSGMKHVEVFNDLTKLRWEPSMQWGEMIDIIHNDDAIYAYLRKAEGFETFLVAINLSPVSSTVDLRQDENLVPECGTIVATTKNFESSRADDFESGTRVTLDNVKLGSGEGIVVSYPYDFSEEMTEE